jgi:hypothetical protein
LSIQAVNPPGFVDVGDDVDVAVAGVHDPNAAVLLRSDLVLVRGPRERCAECLDVLLGLPAGLVLEPDEDVSVELVAGERLDDRPVHPRSLRDVLEEHWSEGQVPP